jgi:hypothetical protein
VPRWSNLHSHAAGNLIPLLMHKIRQRGILPAFRAHKKATQGIRILAQQADQRATVQGKRRIPDPCDF